MSQNSSGNGGNCTGISAIKKQVTRTTAIKPFILITAQLKAKAKLIIPLWHSWCVGFNYSCGSTLQCERCKHMSCLSHFLVVAASQLLLPLQLNLDFFSVWARLHELSGNKGAWQRSGNDFCRWCRARLLCCKQSLPLDLSALTSAVCVPDPKSVFTLCAWRSVESSNETRAASGGTTTFFLGFPAVEIKAIILIDRQATSRRKASEHPGTLFGHQLWKR